MGTMIPKFELWQDFCTMYLATKFHHPTFNCSENIVLTNRDAIENITSLHYAMPVGSKQCTPSFALTSLL